MRSGTETAALRSICNREALRIDATATISPENKTKPPNENGKLGAIRRTTESKEVASLEGFEPPTRRLEGDRSLL